MTHSIALLSTKRAAMSGVFLLLSGLPSLAEDATSVNSTALGYSLGLTCASNFVVTANALGQLECVDRIANSNLSLTSNYATSAGHSSTASYAYSAGTASYATTAGNALTSNYATNAGSASYATNAGNASYATTANSANTANYATTSNSSGKVNPTIFKTDGESMILDFPNSDATPEAWQAEALQVYHPHYQSDNVAKSAAFGHMSTTFGGRFCQSKGYNMGMMQEIDPDGTATVKCY